jgi:hypothetical protein
VSPAEDASARAAPPRPAWVAGAPRLADLRRDGTVAEWRPRLASGLSGLAVLASVGFSLGLCVWEMWRTNSLYDFVLSNGPAREQGLAAVLWGVGGAGGFTLAAIIVLAVQRRLVGPALFDLARRLSPLALAGLLPIMFHWRLWQGNREIVFLLLGLLLVLGGRKLFEVALAAPPVFGRGAFLARCLADSAELRRTTSRVLPFVIVLLAAAGYAAFFGYHTVVHRSSAPRPTADRPETSWASTRPT